MTGDPLQSVREAQEALSAALDSSDIAAVEAAIASFGASVAELRAAADALTGDDVPARAAELRRLLEQAQMRVNFLTDAAVSRLERLAALRGQGRVPLYSREGR